MLDLTTICEQTAIEMRGILPDKSTSIEILEIYLIGLREPVKRKSGEKIENIKLVRAIVGDEERYYLEKPDSRAHYTLRDKKRAEALAMQHKRVYYAREDLHRIRGRSSF
jgi:hypothetical protein